MGLFQALQTQWRTGVNGHTGLDYNVLYRDIDRIEPKVTNARFDELVAEVGYMERAALKAMHEE